MDKYIKEYLLQYQKLQVNNFGFFEIVYKSAEIHPILHTATIPGKYVVFSENSIENTTELSNFIASKEQITVEKANENIAEWVKNSRNTINEKKEYQLATLGKFIINTMGKIEFISFLDTDISPESFGMEEFTIPVKSVTKTNQQEESADIPPKIQKTENSITKKTKRKRDILLIFLFLILAIVLAAGIICYLYPEDVKEYTKKISYWFDKEQTTKEVQPIPDLENVEENYQVEPTQQNNLQENTIKEEPKAKPIPKIEISTENYYVIIGSFRSEGNAQNFVNQQQKEHPNVVNLGKGQNSDLYMVGIGPYTKTDAETQIRNGKYGWWLLKK